METGRIALSQRLRVLHEVKQKQITQIAAAKRLKISDRHIRRLLFRLKAELAAAYREHKLE
jgi:DNA invertase Pin-like site-specific DNA recombinase